MCAYFVYVLAAIMVQHNDHDDAVAFAAPAAVSPSELWLEPVELHWKFWTAFYCEKTACASSPRRSFKRAGATGWSPLPGRFSRVPRVSVRVCHVGVAHGGCVVM